MDKIFKINKNTTIDGLLIKKLIEKHQDIVKYYERMDRLYKGKFEVQISNNSEYQKQIELFSNRIKYIVDLYNGYFIGQPIRLKSENDKLIEQLETFDKINNSHQINRNLAKNTIKYGHAFDIVFNDEYGITHYTYLDNKNVIFVYDDTVLEEPLFAVYYSGYYDIVSEKTTVKGVIYHSNYTREFTKVNNTFVLEDEIPHNFGRVQITEYIENDERMGVIEQLESLQNGYNQSLTDKSTNNSYFANTYLKILGIDLDMEDDAEELVRNLKEQLIIYAPRINKENGQPVIDFLSKPSNDTGEENLLNRIKNDMHTISHIPDFKEISFSNTSAEAIRLLMWDLDNICSEKEDNFKEALRNRYNLILTMFNALSLTGEDLDNDLDFIFHRNIPQNITAEIDNATKAKTLVSQRTALELMGSVVPNVEDELSRLEKEETALVNKFNDYGVVEDEEVSRDESKRSNGEEQTGISSINKKSKKNI